MLEVASHDYWKFGEKWQQWPLLGYFIMQSKTLEHFRAIKRSRILDL